MELISIIIAAFNVSEWITSCLESVIKQTYMNIEIIIVDDGSTDNTGDLCRKYSENDSRIRYIYQKNMGLSAARNKGISEANGRYLMFIDGDDYIPVDAVEKLYTELKRSDVDVVVGGMILKYPEFEKKIINKVGILSRDECIERMLLRKDITHSASAKLYRKILFENIEYPIGKYYEDQFTTYRVIDNSTKISIINDSVYYYRREREGSILTDVNKREKKCKDLFEASEKLLKYCDVNKKLKKAVIYRFVMDNINIIEVLKNNPTVSEIEQINNSREIIKRNAYLLLGYSKMSLRSKAHMIVRLFN